MNNIQILPGMLDKYIYAQGIKKSTPTPLQFCSQYGQFGL